MRTARKKVKVVREYLEVTQGAAWTVSFQISMWSAAGNQAMANFITAPLPAFSMQSVIGFTTATREGGE